MNTLFSTQPEPMRPAPGTEWSFVRVAVERGLDRGGADAREFGALTYKSAVPLAVGRRVEVPLGRGDPPQMVEGIVVETGGAELADGLRETRIKAVVRDLGVGLPAGHVELARWMASYYVCPLGMVLATMMPAAVKKGIGTRTRLLIERAGPSPSAFPDLTPSARKAWEQIEAIEGDSFPMEPHALAARIDARTLGPINRLVRAGLLRTIEREEVRATRGVWSVLGVEQFEQREAPTLTPAQSIVVDGITSSLGAFGVHLIRGVTGSGKTEVYLRIIRHALDAGKSALVLVPEISLTPQTAGRFIDRFRTLGPDAVAVLHSGLTAAQRHQQWALASSGKARMVVGARSAVFAPLESLGVVVVDEEHASDYKQDQLPRYHGRDVAVKRAHLEGCPVVLGSATPSLESWSNAQGSKYRLWELTDRVGGGRLPRIDVVDMADERRLVAARRKSGGRATDLGSSGSVPSGERSAKAPTSPGGGRWHDNANWDDQIGPTLGAALAETLDDDGQAILLLNRRGWASYLCCASPACGWVFRCDDCDSSMVLHRVAPERHMRKGELVRCHHCLAQKLLPQKCLTCSGPLRTLGHGTQSVEQELLRKFGDRLGARQIVSETGDDPGGLESDALVRVDSDTTESASEWFATLSRFARGEVRVLLGTQMVAKGLDFPNVRLVGVVNADTALNLPDFRAAERTFQLVSQVAGRAGRGDKPGRVIVQTYSPNAPAILFAARHDYIGFAAEEMQIRRRSGLPPAARMARVVVRDKTLEKAQAAAAKIAEFLRPAGTSGAEPSLRVIGPHPCVISRIAGQHRMGIEVIATGKNARSAIQDALGAARAKGLVKSDAHTAVDVDPIALM